MTIPVLVVTPSPGFGALILQTLEGSDRYQVVLVGNGTEALKQVLTTPFRLCILDSDLEDIPLVDLGQAMRKYVPEIRLVIVPPDNDLSSTVVVDLAPEGYITNPFYPPALLDIMEGVLKSDSLDRGEQPIQSVEPEKLAVEKSLPKAEQALKSPALTWLQDVNRAAQYLTRLTLESAAQAALILQGELLWAYAGGLPQQAAQELALLVAHYWADDGGSDLARFVRLEATLRDYMLYATRLGGDMALVLVFDAETPFSKIRSQAGRLARALSSPPGNDDDLAIASPGAQLDTPAVNGRGITQQDESYTTTPVPTPLFDDVPPPSPLGWQSTPVSQVGDEPLSFETDLEGDIGPEYPAEYPAENPLEYPPEFSPEMNTPESEGEGLGVGGKLQQEARMFDDSLTDKGPEPVNRARRNYPGDLRTPSPLKDSTKLEDSLLRAGFQPVQAAVYSLGYACVLVPRLPQHHLIGELATRLSEWMVHLCLAFDWRLEHLSVRPDYLQWVVSVTPDVAPAYAIQLIRQHTSQRIFAEFPSLARENPSGDFWAPGYMVMSGMQPPTVPLMQEFVRQIRQRQGTNTLRPE